MEDLILVLIDEDPSKVVRIDSNLCDEDRRHLTSFLQANADIFAWSAFNMPGIDLEVIIHQLNVDPKHRSIKQKKCSFAPKQQKTIQKEVVKLLKVGFIWELYYSKWLANVVLIKKANGKWHAYIDYTDLNKACSCKIWCQGGSTDFKAIIMKS